jgi:hypothetical protein
MDHLQIFWILWSGMWGGFAMWAYYNWSRVGRELTREQYRTQRQCEIQMHDERRIRVLQGEADGLRNHFADNRRRGDELHALNADLTQEVARLRKCGEESYRHQRELETMLDAIRAIVVSPADGTRYMAVELVPNEDDE